jgi:hypothetical protein
MGHTEGGVLRRAVNRLATSAKEHEAAELRKDCVDPRAGVPALVAELYDGTGSMSLVWLGRRQIPGIEPGRSLVGYGRVMRYGEQPVIFNPRYELRPTGTGE